MNDPLRFRDDPDAPADLRADLRSAADARVAFDAAGGLARLLAATAATAASLEVAKAAAQVGASGSAAPTAAAAGKGLALVLGKGVYWGLAVIGTAGVVATVSIHRGDAPPAPPPAPAVATVDPAPPPIAPAPKASPSDEPRAKDPEPPAPVSSARPARRPLAEEIKHLADLRERLDQQPADVLADAERGDRAFPGGALAQEREALAIEALVRLGRAEEARARAEGFAARYPKSPLVARMRALTGW